MTKEIDFKVEEEAATGCIIEIEQNGETLKFELDNPDELPLGVFDDALTKDEVSGGFMLLKAGLVAPERDLEALRKVKMKYIGKIVDTWTNYFKEA